MFNVLTESFLFQYFLTQALLGEFNDGKNLFRVLGKIFCITDDEISSLFNLTQSGAVSEISTEEGFKRYKRIKQYNALVGNASGYTKDEELLIAIKGNAIVSAVKYGLDAGREATLTQVADKLLSGAENGNIAALRLVGILKCEGMLVEKDIVGGVAQLTKAMRWGDVCATLAMFTYSDVDKFQLFKVLNASVKNTPFEFLPKTVADFYGVIAEGCDEEVSLVRRAINANRLNKDTFDPMYARLIFSEAIGIKDKERIVFSENKETVSEACDLPLHLKYGDISLDEEAIGGVPLNRQDEFEGVITGLYSSDLRTLDAFRPMCLSCDSDYVTERYLSAIERALPTAHIERIVVGELREYDLQPTKNNVFVRGLDERSNNVWLLIFKGEISEGVIEAVTAVLRSEKRRKFQLYHPTVCLDLSSVLPICICDGENAAKLKNLVELIPLASVNSAEKPDAIGEVVERKRTDYSFGKVTLTSEVVERLCAMPVESAEKVLDKVLRQNRRKSLILNIDMDIVKPHLDRAMRANNTYGFGGVDDESK